MKSLAPSSKANKLFKKKNTLLYLKYDVSLKYVIYQVVFGNRPRLAMLRTANLITRFRSRRFCNGFRR